MASGGGEKRYNKQKSGYTVRGLLTDGFNFMMSLSYSMGDIESRYIPDLDHRPQN